MGLVGFWCITGHRVQGVRFVWDLDGMFAPICMLASSISVTLFHGLLPLYTYYQHDYAIPYTAAIPTSHQHPPHSQSPMNHHHLHSQSQNSRRSLIQSNTISNSDSHALPATIHHYHLPPCSINNSTTPLAIPSSSPTAYQTNK